MTSHDQKKLIELSVIFTLINLLIFLMLKHYDPYLAFALIVASDVAFCYIAWQRYWEKIKKGLK